MKKQVLLLAVSCKQGGLCPGGLDMDNPSQWIRITKDDGNAGPVQGIDIDFAEPLDVIEFIGRPVPQGKQRENWVIDYNSCKKVGSYGYDILEKAYNTYSYHAFWGNYKPYLNEAEFNAVVEPSESILRVSNVRIYKNNNNRAKIDFEWSQARYPIKNISMTDQNFYDQIKFSEVLIKEAYIVISIPKAIDDWVLSNGEKRAYKFVSKIFKI